MTLELFLDILLSAIVLCIYHSDCAATDAVSHLEFAVPIAIPADRYDYTCIPTITPVMEWELEPDLAGPVPDSLIASIADTLAINYPDSQASDLPTTVKELRSLAVAIGVKNGSRMSKKALIEAIVAARS